MAKAYKCDRCGKLYEKKIFKDPELRVERKICDQTCIPPEFYLRMDLCNECQMEIENFVWSKYNKDKEVLNTNE